jgi:glycosyltransferase involved in cell wall biosynthesis
MIHKDSNFITVGIPTYNSSKYLKSCLMSVLSLKKVNQIIISDDCSQIDEIEYIEKLLETIKQKTNKEIVFLKSKKNNGAYVNKYNLIEACTNKFIYLLDSDNIAQKNLDRTINKILNTENAENLLFQPNTMFQFWKYHKVARFFSKFRKKYKVKFYSEDKIIDISYVKDSLILNSGDYDLTTLAKKNTNLTPQLHEDTLIDKWIFWVLNCGNFIVSKNKMLEVGKQGLKTKRQLRSVDAIVFSYLWLNSGLKIKILRKFYHHHRKRDDSVSFAEKDDSTESIKYYIGEVLNKK